MQIDALNWQLPLTIRWNVDLFNAPYLPVEQGLFGTARMDGGYFFLVNNDPPLQAFNMLLDDSVHVPDEPIGEYLFPFAAGFSPDSGIGIPNVDHRVGPLTIVGNPSRSTCIIRCADVMKTMWLCDLDGRLLYIDHLAACEASIPLDFVRPGTYLLSVRTNTNHYYHERLVKVD